MAMNVSQFQPSDNFNMAEFNDKITQINSGVNSEVSALKTLINEGAKIETGTYTGTGTYGASNPNSLTFGFAPKFVFVARQNDMGSYPVLIACSGMTSVGVFRTASSATYRHCQIQWNGNMISWWGFGDADAGDQMNYSGVIYNYFAIG